MAKVIEELEALLRKWAKCNYVLRLYVTAGTARSSLAIANLKVICDGHLKGRCLWTVVDLYRDSASAKEDQIVVSPTLVKRLPLPTRRLVGDLSDTQRVLAALDLMLPSV